MRTSHHSPSQKFPGRIFFFFFFFFHSLPFNPSIFCEQRDLLFDLSRLYFPKKNFFFFSKKKKNLSHEKHSLFFFHQVFLASLFHHFLFLFITFRICLCFSFPFLLDLLFSWSPSSWTHFSCTSLSIFFEQQFLLEVVSTKKTFQIFPFYLHWLPRNVLLAHTLLQIKKNMFVHFPFCWAPFHI